MASLPNPKTVTYEEWLRMPEVQDAIEEVVNGEVRIMPPYKLPHGRIVMHLCDALSRRLGDGFWVFASSFGLVIRKAPLTCRQPHLAVFEKSRVVEEDGFVRSAPELIAEILSPVNTRKHAAEKLSDYAELGVPEVWVVSPEARTVEVLDLENGYLRTTQILSHGLLQPKRFPHVQIPIAEIWPD